jgi:hypothetical protein
MTCRGQVQHRVHRASVYSITSSAMASSVGGSVSPSSLAVERLMTSSNFDVNSRVAGIIGRDDEPEMMPVPFAALGKGAAVYVISRRDAAP